MPTLTNARGIDLMITHASRSPGRRVHSVSDCALRRSETSCNIRALIDGVRCRVAVLRSAIVAFGVWLMAIVPANAVDLDELTVVTLARDGSWGEERAHKGQRLRRQFAPVGRWLVQRAIAALNSRRCAAVGSSRACVAAERLSWPPRPGRPPSGRRSCMNTTSNHSMGRTWRRADAWSRSIPPARP